MTVAPWQGEAWERLVARRARGALPHALLISGPAGLGKRAFAERFAAWLLCENAVAQACGQCRSCRLFAVRSQRDPEETRPDGTLAQPDGHPGHPDAKFVGYVWNEDARPKRMYTQITVEQMRELSAWLALTPQFGRAQVVVIEPADELNVAAANALLKTLEEPSAGRYLLLVTAHPARLPATIRSRCQRIDFGLPAGGVALAWLEQQDIGAADAAIALEASGGNPGLALAWSRGGQVALRAEVASALRALAQGKGDPSAISAAWARSEPEARLWFAAMLVQAEGAAAAAGSRGPLALTAAADLTKLSAWFDQVNKTRELLRGPLRVDLLLLELLLAWEQAVAPHRRSAARAG